MTPSPKTQLANQSFQGHLDSLDAETKMRKKKVMDWIQKTRIQSWERENMRKEDSDPSKLQMDPVSHLPAQPYMKQEPIYADVDAGPHLDSTRKQKSDSLPRGPEWRGGVADQRYRAEPVRQRGATVTGSKMEHFPTVAQRQYPTPSWQSAAAQGRGGREAGQGVQLGRGVREVQRYAGQGAQGRGREVWGSAGHGAQGRGVRGIQGSTGQDNQGRWVRDVRGSAGQEGLRRGRGEIQAPGAGQGTRGYPAQGVQRRDGREIQSDGVHNSAVGEPNFPASYPTARFEKDYYVLDV